MLQKLLKSLVEMTARELQKKFPNSKIPLGKIRLGKKFNFDLIAYFIQILDSESMCSSSVRFVPYRLNMFKKALI